MENIRTLELTNPQAIEFDNTMKNLALMDYADLIKEKRVLEGLILSYALKLHGLGRQHFEKHFNIETNRYGGE